MACLREWHNRRVNAAKEVVIMELAKLWVSDESDDVTQAYAKHSNEPMLRGSTLKLVCVNLAAPSLMRAETQSLPLTSWAPL